MAELSVNVTPRAAQQIKAQLSKRAQTTASSGVRLGVKGGGCSGMSYVIEYCDSRARRTRCSKWTERASTWTRRASST